MLAQEGPDDRSDSEKAAQRDHFAIAADPIRGRIVVHGGNIGNQWLQDSWQWDGSAWTTVETNSLPARSSHSMIFDPVSERVLLFGGISSGSVVRGDTWM